jgi:Aminotransferase class-III
MAAYVDNAPVVERAEGRELIDADGRRHLDAISSLWVNTLGHHVPELDAALAAQAARVAHSTMLGNGNTVVVELAEALARAVPVDEPHFLFAADGAVAVEQALKIAFQYWVNEGVPGRARSLALVRRLPRRHHRCALARRPRRVQRRRSPCTGTGTWGISPSCPRTGAEAGAIRRRRMPPRPRRMPLRPRRMPLRRRSS